MKLSLGARRLLNILRSYGREIFPRQETIGRKLDWGIRTVNRYMKELREAGLVEVQFRGPRSAEYRLINQEVRKETGVPSEVSNIFTVGCVKQNENLSIGVPCGVAFGVPSAPHLLLSVFSSSSDQYCERFIEASDDCPPSPNPNPEHALGPDQLEPGFQETVSGGSETFTFSQLSEASSVIRKPWPDREIHSQILQIAQSKRIGGSP